MVLGPVPLGLEPMDVQSAAKAGVKLRASAC